MHASHGVRAALDLHVWTLTSGRDALSAHVRVDDLADGRHVLGDLQQLLQDRLGTAHVAIQLDPTRRSCRSARAEGRRLAGPHPSTTTAEADPKTASGRHA